MKRLLLTGCVLFCAVFGFAQEVEMRPLIETSALTETFRCLIAGKTEVVQSKGVETQKAFFTLLSWEQWEAARKQYDLADVPLADFMAGAVAMIGPAQDKGAISALYNPWQDAVLLLRWSAAREYDEERNPQIVQHVFLCGEAFRGEVRDPLSVATVIPPADKPLSVVIWEKVKATANRFDTLYPQGGKLALHTTAWDLEPAMARAALRLKWWARLGEPQSQDLLRIQLIARQLRFSDRARLDKLFPDPNTDFFRRTWAELPAKVRQDLAPYGWYAVEGEKGREMMIVYILSSLPSRYLTVSLRTGKTPVMEWFDLTQASEALAIWNSKERK